MSLTKLTKGDGVKIVSSPDLVKRLLQSGWTVEPEAKPKPKVEDAELEQEASAKRGRPKKA